MIKLTGQLTMMQKQRNPAKLLSLSSKPSVNRCPDRVMELELELREAHSHIQILKETNQQLLRKLEAVERKCEDMKIIEEELEFRREQQKQMQEHLDNYQQINAKLRAQLHTAEQSFKNSKVTQDPNPKERQSLSELPVRNNRRFSTPKLDDECLMQESRDNHRKSIGECPKENHPLTPKSRVKISYEGFGLQELDSMHQINARRKAFM